LPPLTSYKNHALLEYPSHSIPESKHKYYEPKPYILYQMFNCFVTITTKIEGGKNGKKNENI